MVKSKFSKMRGLFLLSLLIAVLALLPARVFSQEGGDEPPPPAPPAGAPEEDPPAPAPGPGLGVEEEEEDDDDIDPDNLVLVGRKNEEVTQLIEAASNAPLAHAVEMYQDIIERSRDEYYDSYYSFSPTGDPEDEVYVPAREFCLREIQLLPESSRQLYNQLYGSKAQSMLDESLSVRDYDLLERTASDYILTAAGEKAARAMVEILMARGDYYRALYFVEQLRNFYPAMNDPVVFSQEVFCRLRMGDANAVRAMMKKADDRVLETEVRMGGEIGHLGETVRRAVEELDDYRKRNRKSVFNSFTETVVPELDNASLGYMDHDSIKSGQYYHLQHGPDNLNKRGGRRTHYFNNRRTYLPGGSSCLYPILVDDRLIYVSEKGVRVIDLTSMSLVWDLPVENEKKTSKSSRHSRSYMRRYLPSIRFDAEYNDGCLYVLFGGGSDTVLTAIDLTPGEERVVWRIHPGQVGELENFTFNSTPLARGGNLYLTGLVNRNNQEFRVKVVCLDAKTGRMFWNTEICTIPTIRRYNRYMGSEVVNKSSLLESEGSLYVVSNLGVIARISAHTGMVNWIKKYPRPTRSGGNVWGSLRRSGKPTSWEPTAPVFHRGAAPGGGERRVLMVAPSDSTFIAGVDPDSGRFEYMIHQEPFEPGYRYLLGAWRRFAFAHGRIIDRKTEQMLVFDVFTGKRIAELTYDFATRGKGLIVGHVLYVPGNRKVQPFDLRVMLDEKKLASLEEYRDGFNRALASEDSEKAEDFADKAEKLRTSMLKDCVLDDERYPSNPDDKNDPLFGNLLFHEDAVIVAGNKWVRIFKEPLPEPPQEKELKNEQGGNKPPRDSRNADEKPGPEKPGVPDGGEKPEKKKDGENKPDSPEREGKKKKGDKSWS